MVSLASGVQGQLQRLGIGLGSCFVNLGFIGKIVWDMFCRCFGKMLEHKCASCGCGIVACCVMIWFGFELEGGKSSVFTI